MGHGLSYAALDLSAMALGFGPNFVVSECHDFQSREFERLVVSSELNFYFRLLEIVMAFVATALYNIPDFGSIENQPHVLNKTTKLGSLSSWRVFHDTLLKIYYIQCNDTTTIGEVGEVLQQSKHAIYPN